MRKVFFVNLIMALLMILLLSLNSGLPPAVPATASGDFYVSPDGSDKNPGTEEQPWQTVQKAAESVASGSTVYIRAGTYYERVNIKVSGASAQEPVIFRNYQNDKVIIDGSRSDASAQEDVIRIADQNFVRLIGLEITNNVNSDPAYFIAGIGIWGKGEGIEIRDCKVHAVQYTGTSGKGAANGVAVYGTDAAAPVSGLVIDGCELWDVGCGAGAAAAVSGNVDGFEFTNNYVHDNDNTGLALIGGGTFKDGPVCTDSAVNLARNGLAAYNKMENNSRAGNPAYFENDFNSAAIYADGAEDITVAYNTCIGNDIGVRVGNEARDKVSSGIAVRDNLIYRNNSSGIMVGGNDMHRGWAADCRFLNNTLYQNDTQRQGRGEIFIAKSRSLLFSGNIVCTGPQNLVVSTQAFGPEYIYNIAFDHNLYFGPGGARDLRLKGVDTGLWGLNMWKSRTKQDINSKIADPKFADPAEDDFRLLEKSPAIDLGDPAYIPSEGERDLDGNPRKTGKAVDCGAYEFIMQ
jgi:hypothetical protein